MTGLVLSEREQHLFRVLVENYIDDGQPVGSTTLVKNSGLKLSSATVRNVMSDLEEMGLLDSPHTSAGRIPTAQGLRLFVDRMLCVKPLSEIDVGLLHEQVVKEEGTTQLMQSVSSTLSNLTQMAGVVMLPRNNRNCLRHLEFLPLSGSRVLAILVVNEQEVQNRIITTQRDFSAAELEQAANYLNALLGGSDLSRVRDAILKEMQDARQDMDRIMRSAIDMAEQVFDQPAEQGDFLMDGQTNLMSYAEMADMGKLRRLFDSFNTKQDVLQLLDQSMQAEGVQIFIGQESGYQVFDGCSVVTAPYGCSGSTLGVLGVIGPARMAYDRVVPMVDATAKLLGSLLKEKK